MAVGLLAILGWLLLSAGAAPAAPGWDSDDWIITNAPNFPQRIAIFDHDFTFKSWLETNFLGVQGIDFDAAGRLVAVSSINPEVRVYDPSGIRVGGFNNVSGMMGATGDLKVLPDGNYIMATANGTGGARVFTPTGAFVRQYGSQTITAVVLLPENRLWTGGMAVRFTMNVFDFASGAQVGTIALDGHNTPYSMTYSGWSNTVLIADNDLDSVVERRLDGTFVHRFEVPSADNPCLSVVRGPGGDIFATSGHDPDVVHWRPDGTLVDWPDVFPWPDSTSAVKMLYAGTVPEPSTAAAVMLVGAAGMLARRRG